MHLSLGTAAAAAAFIAFVVVAHIRHIRLSASLSHSLADIIIADSSAD